MTGEPKFRKKLSRQSFLKFMAELPPAAVVMEACGSAHYWAREMIRLGHEVKLIAPHYVKPFVKRQKNDAADAEAIVIAAQRPEMRFVDPKSAEQQSRAVLFRARGAPGEEPIGASTDTRFRIHRQCHEANDHRENQIH